MIPSPTKDYSFIGKGPDYGDYIVYVWNEPDLQQMFGTPYVPEPFSISLKCIPNITAIQGNVTLPYILIVKDRNNNTYQITSEFAVITATTYNITWCTPVSEPRLGLLPDGISEIQLWFLQSFIDVSAVSTYKTLFKFQLYLDKPINASVPYAVPDFCVTTPFVVYQQPVAGFFVQTDIATTLEAVKGYNVYWREQYVNNVSLRVQIISGLSYVEIKQVNYDGTAVTLFYKTYTGAQTETLPLPFTYRLDSSDFYNYLTSPPRSKIYVKFTTDMAASSSNNINVSCTISKRLIRKAV